VAAVRYSRLAKSDLSGIGRYTLRTWGEAQTIQYLIALRACCQTLSENRELGRQCDDVRPRLRRLECGSHVVFYRVRRDGILISRILHQRMLPRRHRFEESDQ